MGLFDRFKKKKEDNNVKNIPEKEEKVPYKFSNSEDGKFQIDYTNPNPDFKKFYDSTRLIIDDVEQDLVNCRVSWYSDSDCIMIDKEGKRIGRMNQYKDILTKIDFNLLKNDPAYVRVLMEELLDKARVERYLMNGLQEKSEQPSGKYVGSIDLIDGVYRKYFDSRIGIMSHNSPEMQIKRQEYKELKNMQKELEIKRKQDEINRLQNEIDDMSK